MFAKTLAFGTFALVLLTVPALVQADTFAIADERLVVQPITTTPVPPVATVEPVAVADTFALAEENLVAQPISNTPVPPVLTAERDSVVATVAAQPIVTTPVDPALRTAIQTPDARFALRGREVAPLPPAVLVQEAAAAGIPTPTVTAKHPQVTPANPAAEIQPDLPVQTASQTGTEVGVGSCAQVYPYSALCNLPFGPVQYLLFLLGF